MLRSGTASPPCQFRLIIVKRRRVRWLTPQVVFFVAWHTNVLEGDALLLVKAKVVLRIFIPVPRNVSEVRHGFETSDRTDCTKVL